MKVEEIVETKMETYERRNTIYKTSDGKTFLYLWEAKRHEKELDIKALKERTDLESAAEAFTPYGDYFSLEENSYMWYKAKTPEAIEAINENYGVEIPEKYVNEWICVEDNDEDADYYALKTSVDEFSKLLEKLGYEIEIKEKPKTEDIK